MMAAGQWRRAIVLGAAGQAQAHVPDTGGQKKLSPANMLHYYRRNVVARKLLM